MQPGKQLTFSDHIDVIFTIATSPKQISYNQARPWFTKAYWKPYKDILITI